MAARCEAEQGKLVGALDPVAGRAIRGTPGRAGGGGEQAPSLAGRGAREVRPAMIGSRAARLEQLVVDGQGLRVGVWPGSAARPPLLLFNGIGGNLELLAPFVDALGDVEVISFDMPGVGGSAARLRPYRLPAMARLAARLLTRLRRDTV